MCWGLMATPVVKARLLGAPMQAVLHKEQIIIHGCLARAGSQGARCLWKRHRVWLLQDRLCYASVFATRDSIHYIPLDRITVRPLPRGYKPRIGVQHVDASLIALPEARAGNAAPEQPQGRVFSVQYGSRMVYWAADTSTEAKAWMQAIRDAWVAAVLSPDRCVRAGEALQVDSTDWGSRLNTAAQNRKDSDTCVSGAGSEEWDQEALCEVEVHTKEAKGWMVNAMPWMVLHGLCPGNSSARHLLIPATGAAEAFSSAAVAFCQIRVPAALATNISSVELGLTGDCILWAPSRVLIRPGGQSSWTEFPCDSTLSNCLRD